MTQPQLSRCALLFFLPGIGISKSGQAALDLYICGGRRLHHYGRISGRRLFRRARLGGERLVYTRGCDVE
jgi:hypothetical protein